MPCLFGRYTNPPGIILKVAVLPLHQRPTEGEALVGQTIHGFDALADTGASGSCISRKVVEQVGLQPHGKREMISASHTTEVNTFLILLGIPIGIRPEPRGTVSGQLTAFGPIEALEFNADATAFDVLLGMDVLGQGSVKFEADGHFSFCF